MEPWLSSQRYTKTDGTLVPQIWALIWEQSTRDSSGTHTYIEDSGQSLNTTLLNQVDLTTQNQYFWLQRCCNGYLSHASVPAMIWSQKAFLDVTLFLKEGFQVLPCWVLGKSSAVWGRCQSSRFKWVPAPNAARLNNSWTIFNKLHSPSL